MNTRSARILAALAQPELIALAILLIALAAFSQSRDFSWPYLLSSTSLYMEVGIMALAMSFLIISGNIDLSIAANLALTGVLCARLHAAGVPMPVVTVFGPVIGALLGLFNGVLVALLRLPSLVVTLGTLALYRGLAQAIAGDYSIGGFPEWFLGADTRFAGPFPLPLVIFLALAVVAAVLLHKSIFGRVVYSIGTSEPAALFSGMHVARTKLIVFILSGAAAGLGAMLMLSRLSYARWDHALGEELAVITAVVLGGTSIFGGRGTILGTAAALFALGIIRTMMHLRNVPAEKQLAATGALLIAAVLLTTLAQQLSGFRSKGAARE